MPPTVVIDDSEPATASPSRRVADRLPAIRLWCRQRADYKRTRAAQIAPLRLQGRSHDAIRVKLGLTLGDYRRAKHWMNEAVAMCVASREPITIAQALEQIADRQIDVVTRLGLLREQGATKQQVRERLGLTEDEWQVADEWWRDAVAATERGQDDD